MQSKPNLIPVPSQVDISVAGVPVQLLPVNQNRHSLFMQITGTSTIIWPNLSQLTAMLNAGAAETPVTNFLMSIEQHGPIVCSSWFAINVGSSSVFILEWSDNVLQEQKFGSVPNVSLGELQSEQIPNGILPSLQPRGVIIDPVQFQSGRTGLRRLRAKGLIDPYGQRTGPTAKPIDHISRAIRLMKLWDRNQ